MENRCPSKLKIFHWRLAQQSIPTVDLLHHRNISTPTSYRLCGAEDSWQHSLLHFHIACCVWVLQDPESFQVLGDTTEHDAKRWVFVLMDVLPTAEFIHVLTTLWAIWYSRRQALHEHIFQSPLANHHFIIKYIQELDDCNPKKLQRGYHEIHPKTFYHEIHPRTGWLRRVWQK